MQSKYDPKKLELMKNIFGKEDFKPEDVLKLRLPGSCHELLEYSPTELYDIDRSQAARVEGEDFDDYKMRQRLKRKISQKRNLLREIEMIPVNREEYDKIKEAMKNAEKDEKEKTETEETVA